MSEHVSPEALELRRLLRLYGHPTLGEALAALERAGVEPKSVAKAPRKAAP